jgi:hypothetical protein
MLVIQTTQGCTQDFFTRGAVRPDMLEKSPEYPKNN